VDDAGRYRHAFEQAVLGRDTGGIPIGAALLRGEAVLGSGHNRRLQDGDPTAHAEISALRAAGVLDDYRDTTLYTTYRPCILCAGAVVLFGIPRVVVGQSRDFPVGRRPTSVEPSVRLLESEGVELLDLDDAPSADLLDGWVAGHGQTWLRDNGKWRPG
jgi:cytosine/creatinine deaminase